VFDPETGEITGPAFDPVAIRLERFALQSVSREILPEFRVCHCMRKPQQGHQGVEVRQSIATGRAFFAGLQTCGSVWVDPVCSSKISESRRKELQAAIDAHVAQGGAVALLTLTCPHNRGDALESLLTRQGKALKRFWETRQAKELLKALGVVGHVRAWEITHGWLRETDNGWHPHFHILLFLSAPHDGGLDQFVNWAYALWAQSCERAGLGLPSERHGVTLQDGEKAGEYVAKMGLEAPAQGLEAARASGGWTASHELTKGHSKRAKNADGGTPFDMLRAQLLGSDPRARELFREFAFATKGRRQLVWSRGLRERLGLGVAPSDEAIAGDVDPLSIHLSQLTREQWAQVLRLDARGELLEVASHGVEALSRFLKSLPTSTQGASHGR
jgi:hypothetical protein